MNIDHLASWAVVVAFFTGIPGAIAGTYAFVRHRVHSTTVSLQEEEIKVLTQRLNTMRSENDQKDTKIAALEAQVQALRDIVTSAAKVDQLRSEIAAYHGLVDTGLTRIAAAMERLAEK